MPDHEDAAWNLAQQHYAIDEGVTGIWRIVAAAALDSTVAEPIRLLEVNRHTIPAGILPIHFGPSPAAGVDRPSVILEVTPEEFAEIEGQQLLLPSGWRLGPMIERRPIVATP